VYGTQYRQRSVATGSHTLFNGLHAGLEFFSSYSSICNKPIEKYMTSWFNATLTIRILWIRLYRGCTALQFFYDRVGGCSSFSLKCAHVRTYIQLWEYSKLQVGAKRYMIERLCSIWERALEKIA